MTRPGRLLALAAVLFAVAVLLAPSPSAEGGTTLTALGRSLGGLRVALVDTLFLRAEALRRRGRVEEVPSLYDAVLQLDPENTPARDFLADVYARDVLPQATSAEGRFAWWKRAWDVIQEGRRRQPDRPDLMIREGDLLLTVAPSHDGLDAKVEELVGDAEMRGLRRLVEAARCTGYLPRWGRYHLGELAHRLPLAAAFRLRARREGVAQLLSWADEVLETRRGGLAAMSYPIGDPDDPASAEPDAPFESLDVLLELGLAAVRATATGDRAAAGAAVDAYRRTFPFHPLSALLDDVLGGR